LELTRFNLVNCTQCQTVCNLGDLIFLTIYPVIQASLET